MKCVAKLLKMQQTWMMPDYREHGKCWRLCRGGRELIAKVKRGWKKLEAE